MQEARGAQGARGEGDMGGPGDAAQAGTRAVKVVLVGDGGCGKTSLLMVFAAGAFPEVSRGAPDLSSMGGCCAPRCHPLPAAPSWVGVPQGIVSLC